MTHLFDIHSIIITYGYIGIFIIIFFESGIFPPLPGDSLLFAAGLYAAVGGFNLYLLAMLVFAASFLGILSGYYAGVHIKKLERFSLFKRIFRREHIESADNFFIRHGRSAIILSRFIPIVRTFVPITAGIARMDHSSFVRYSLIGSLLWSVIFICGGFFLGRSFPQIGDHLTLAIIIIVILSILPGIYHWLKNRK